MSEYIFILTISIINLILFGPIGWAQWAPFSNCSCSESSKGRRRECLHNPTGIAVLPLFCGEDSLENETAPCTTDELLVERCWVVIQSRGQFGNAEDYFDRTWVEYVDGFGEPGTTFFVKTIFLLSFEYPFNKFDPTSSKAIFKGKSFLKISPESIFS